MGPSKECHVLQLEDGLPAGAEELQALLATTS